MEQQDNIVNEESNVTESFELEEQNNETAGDSNKPACEPAGENSFYEPAMREEEDVTPRRKVRSFKKKSKKGRKRKRSPSSSSSSSSDSSSDESGEENKMVKRFKIVPKTEEHKWKLPTGMADYANQHFQNYI
ncbi:protein FAM133A-like [Hydractinia symbiolongicarpus]|uniref:protein FAM133A-like n=1 Tax=Hydractinia symbiolongicarpus TaxID=13093 RepID=UPI00254FDEC9|nr:protein FAM133A-like [Hydractinia symbiolongicarpus]